MDVGPKYCVIVFVCVGLMRLVVVVVSVNAVLVCRGPIYVLIFNMTSAARSVSVYPPRGVCGCFDRLLFKLYVQY